VTAIIDGVQRMDTLIEDLLAYSRVDAASLAVTLSTSRPRSAVASSARAGDRSASRRGDHRLVADHRQRRQPDRATLLNLLSNALKFIAPDTRPRISVWAEREQDGWTVTVCDNGIGIDGRRSDERVPHVRAVHGEERYAGTGIGLAICHRIVDRHGGRIWVDDNPGGGSRFHFTLPTSRLVSTRRAPRAAGPPKKPPRDPPPSSSSRARRPMRLRGERAR